MLTFAWGNSAYLSHAAWAALSHSAKVACLRLLADRAWVEGEVERRRIAAVKAVERRWLDLPRNATPEDLPVFERERGVAASRAPTFWESFGGSDDRCIHAATFDGCRVRDCVHQWRPPPPPADRYFKGALRQHILERDGFMCQYCGKSVRDDLPRDHVDKANIDHVIPYPEGPTTLENGKTACTVCNALKGINEKLPVEVRLDDALATREREGEGGRDRLA